jgi:hypothetical protein
LASFKEFKLENITQAADIVKTIGFEAEMHVKVCLQVLSQH